MGGRGDHRTPRGTKSTLQEKVAQFYYAHGLICSSYPTSLVFTAICVTALFCFPLLNVPIPGNAPHQTRISSINVTLDPPAPLFYVQQVVMRTAVLPWESDLSLGDAFRAPLYETFKLLEVIRNYQHPESQRTLGHVCLHVEAVRKRKSAASDVLPQYSCLALSPANLWQQDVQKFAEDASLLSTIFERHNFQKGKTSVAEMLFGMKMDDTGIKRYPFRNRFRPIQYAVTLFFKEYDPEFLHGLRSKLESLYPLHQGEPVVAAQTNNNTLLIQYPGEINLYEFIPITVTFILLFLYFYFSFRKIELIESKLGMALAAVITVLSSLSMTYGLCFFFGLTLKFEGQVVFPYFVVLVGLENVLCLTKSIISSPLHLDVKIRIAQGLSKEGWSITKNLLLEITILTFGILTLVPVIQEFCIFAIVGLVCDYFMQIVFFSTVLGIDIRRKESASGSNNFKSSFYQSQAYYEKALGRSMRRSKSHPRLSAFPADVVAGGQQTQDKKIPKRLKLVNIWTRTRFFHRAFMILMIIWIGNIAYNSQFFEHILHNNHTESQHRDNYSGSSIKLLSLNDTFRMMNNYVTHSPLNVNLSRNYTDDLEKLVNRYDPLTKLSPQHWSTIVRAYNLTVSGQQLVVLAPIKLSHVIRPEQAVLLRNPQEKYGEKFQWQALAAALDPIDFVHAEQLPESEQPFYPTSVLAVIFISVLCVISVGVLAYTVVVLYRCICSRNYAEWRASWFNSDRSDDSGEEQVLLEHVPIVLDGHRQQVECIATDGASVVSSCLEGQLKVWDTTTGELINCIDRKAYFAADSAEEAGDIEAIPTERQPRIRTNFSTVRQRPRSTHYDAGEDFRRVYTELYHRRDEVENVVKSSSFNETSQRVGRHTAGNESKKQSPIWCLDYLDNLIVIGCANGRLEVWEASTGRLKCIFEDGSSAGINSVKIVGSRVVASRLYGTLDLLQLESYNHGRPVDWNFTCAYRRTHVRTGSVDSMPANLLMDDHDEELHCRKITTLKAHQQPITCLDCEGGRIVTGSQDHTVRVFRLEDGKHQYTLHGHCGPITCLFIDRVCPMTAGSGSQDGTLCLWDLQSGACVYSTQAHDGSVTSLTYSASYVISLGSDDRLCVWERFQGHLLNTIQVAQQTFASQVLMLAPHLAVTARSGGLSVWDVRTGECVRNIGLGRSPFVFIKQLILLRDAVLCDYGTQLRLLRFPLITHKFD